MRELLLNDLIADAVFEEGEAVEFACLPSSAHSLQLSIGGVLLEPFLRPADPHWRWRWLAPAAAGTYPLLLCADQPAQRIVLRTVTIEVVPRKLDLAHYHALLDDLQECETRLLVSLNGGAHPATRSERRTPESLEELLGLLDLPLAQLFNAVTRLSQRPPDRLKEQRRPTPADQLRDPARIDPRRLPASTEPIPVPARLAAAGPLTEMRSSPSYDSYEHRLLARLLDILARRVGSFVRRTDLPVHLHQQLMEVQQRLRSLRNAPFLAELPPLGTFHGPSVRLQREADWRIVYRFWQALRRRPQITWDVPSEELTVSDLPRLYERWCALQVALALLDIRGYTLIGQTLAEPQAGAIDWRMALHSREPLLTLHHEQQVVRLFYQPRYRPGQGELVALDRHTRVPDLVIERRKSDQVPQLFILEAKYRLDARGGVPADAMADAYSYLGGIGTPGGTRVVQRVALLYPGGGAAAVYPSGVAALPLLPGDDGVDAWITDSVTG